MEICEVFIFDDVFLVLGVFLVLLLMVDMWIFVMCKIGMNILLLLLVMDIVIELKMVIVMV